jgi:hypothetical protein
MCAVKTGAQFCTIPYCYYEIMGPATADQQSGVCQARRAFVQEFRFLWFTADIIMTSVEQKAKLLQERISAAIDRIAATALVCFVVIG